MEYKQKRIAAMPHTRPPRLFSAERHARQSGRFSLSERSFENQGFGSGEEAEMAPLAVEISQLRLEIAELRASMGSLAKDQRESSSEPDSMDEIIAVQTEITQMVKSIGKAKAEIAAIKHPMSQDDRLHAASNELDAIVTSTEIATSDILEAAEAIESQAGAIANLCHEDEDVITITEQMTAQVIKIMEASNFQDITGQRINKVVDTVRFIEERVLAMIDIWGVDAFEGLPMPRNKAGDESDLLNGPQLENQGISQADIDALFD